MKVYVIHYTKLKDRKENILKVLSNFNGHITFIEDYDKENLDGNTFYLPDETKFFDKIKDLWDPRVHKFRHLNLSEISCTIKHILALDKISKQEEEYGLVLEDDAIPVKDTFSEDLVHIVNTLPKNWNSVFLGAGCGVDFINQKLQKCLPINENIVKVGHPATNCAEAYLIKKDTARRIVNSIIPFQLVSDWELAYQFYSLNMNVYWAIPPLFYQGSKSGKYNSTLR